MAKPLFSVFIKLPLIEIIILNLKVIMSKITFLVFNSLILLPKLYKKCQFLTHSRNERVKNYKITENKQT